MRKRTVLRTWLLFTVLAASASMAGSEGGLFSPRPGKTLRGAGEIGVVRSRAIDVNFGLLAHTAKAGSELRLNLFPDVSPTAVLDRIVFETEETFSWLGHLEAVPGSHVALVAGGGVLAGSVTFEGTAYRIRSTREGFHVVEQVDTGAFPPEMPPIPVLAEDASRSTMPLAKAVDSGDVLDLMVVYTPDARAAVGGKNAIQSLIALGVTETNLAFENSGIASRLRLVHTAEIKYVESENIGLDLARLRTPRDGQMDKVLNWRNARRADLVMLIVDHFSGCGVGYLMAGSGNSGFESSAFSAVHWQCISPNYTFGHEIGHNLGSNHAPNDPDLGTGAFPFSFGYKDPSLQFRDVMSYPCTFPCPRVLHFSSPLITFGGLATGTEAQDNARSINEVRKIVANFRVSRRR